MEQVATYPFSGEAVKEAKRQLLYWQLFLPAMLAIFFFANPSMGDDLLIKLVAFVVTVILLEAFCSLRRPSCLGKWRR